MTLMLVTVLAAAILAVNSQTSNDCVTTPSSFSDAEISLIVSQHNSYRAIDSTATGIALPALVWDANLASRAQAWINVIAPTNILTHSNTSRCPDGAMGENLWRTGTTGTNVRSKLNGATDSWAAEKSYYDYASNSCAPNQMCGHYTQVVWQKTLKFGCGGATYSYLKNTTVWNGFMVACNYSPAGNYVGQKPY